MPKSPSELSPTCDQLRQHLEAAFGDESGAVTVVAGAPVPTLLLQTQKELAAFAISNGNPQQCYDRVYAYFKNLYAERHATWDTLNLSFVFCLTHRRPEVEQFCVALETDVYFCRKFVVFLDQPISRELSRLPFIPLERTDSTFRRPPSARTLLMNNGVPRELAKGIAVPHVLSANRIVQDCLDEKWGKAKLRGDTSVAESVVQRTLPQLVRLESVQIENFRAYRQAQVFDLDADIVVLYGPNGFGKTSFYDAIDFCATAEIGRLRIPDGQKDRLRKSARHLDCGGESSSVTFTVRESTKSRKLLRTVEEHELHEAMLDGVSADRKTVLAALTGLNVGSGADRVENMVRLFRATHLFSQEFQDLTESFRLKSELPADVVSRMLAFEDYVQAGKKLDEVTEVLRMRMRDRNRQIEEKTEALSRERTALAEMQQRVSTSENPEAVAAMVRDVRSKVQAHGIDTGQSRKVSIGEARGWRALIESRIAESRAATERAAGLLTNAPHIATVRSQVNEGRMEVAHKRTAQSEAARALREQQESLANIVGEIARLKGEESELRTRAAALNWIERTRPQYSQLRQTQTAVEGRINSLNAAVATQKAKCDKIASDQQAAEAKLNETQRELAETKQRLEDVEVLPAQHALWTQQVRTTKVLRENVAKANKQIDDCQRQLSVATAVLNEQQVAEQRASAHIARHQQAHRNLQNLLTEIENYIDGATCPVCGDDHGSKENLIGKLHAQSGASPTVSEAAARLQKARDDSSEANRRIEELTTQIRLNREAIISAATEAERIGIEVASFEERARGIAAEAGDPEFASLVFAKRDALRQRVVELSALLGELHRVADKFRSSLREARAIQRDRENELSASTQARSFAEEEVTKLRVEAHRLQVSFDTTITDTEQAVNKQIRGLVANLNAAETKSAARRSAIFTANQKAEALQLALENLVRSLIQPQRAMDSYEADLRILGLGVDRVGGIEQLTAFSQILAKQLSAWEELKQIVINLEVALDASATSAAMAGMKERIRAAEEELRALATTQEQMWLSHFQKLRELLQGVQDMAVASYTSQFGPQASVIQHRLRSVFGFQDIELTAAGSSIEVRVKRNGEPLRPPDYFSQSQQQILILSLFLTVCMTQTWSQFAPIFLDDPVTHFDDLNTYAFLDLISGLLETSLRGRQVVISTCDERLYQIARQRFASLGDRAKLYKFVSLSSLGPIIKQE